MPMTDAMREAIDSYHDVGYREDCVDQWDENARNGLSQPSNWFKYLWDSAYGSARYYINYIRPGLDNPRPTPKG